MRSLIASRFLVNQAVCSEDTNTFYYSIRKRLGRQLRNHNTDRFLMGRELCTKYSDVHVKCFLPRNSWSTLRSGPERVLLVVLKPFC